MLGAVPAGEAGDREHRQAMANRRDAWPACQTSRRPPLLGLGVEFGQGYLLGRPGTS